MIRAGSRQGVSKEAISSPRRNPYVLPLLPYTRQLVCVKSHLKYTRTRQTYTTSSPANLYRFSIFTISWVLGSDTTVLVVGRDVLKSDHRASLLLTLHETSLRCVSAKQLTFPALVYPPSHPFLRVRSSLCVFYRALNLSLTLRYYELSDISVRMRLLHTMGGRDVIRVVFRIRITPT